MEISLKTCSRCKIEKSIVEFYKDKFSNDGFRYQCKPCGKILNESWIKSRAGVTSRKRAYKKWEKSEKGEVYFANPETKAARTSSIKKYEKTQKGKIVRSKIRVKRIVNGKSKQWQAYKYKNDINYRIREVLRSRLRGALARNQKVGSAIKDLGCSILELRKHLESKWLPGMSWKNWDQYGWHIDHIKPLAKFNLQDLGQLKQAVHYTNLQPLWAFDNLSKGAKEVA